MADFPQTAELTSFDLPTQNPLSDGGKWASYGNRYPLQVNAITHPGETIPTTEYGAGNVNGMYWTRDAFVGSCEVWACVAGGGLGAAVEDWRVAFWLNSPESATGYVSAFGGGIGEEYFVRRYDGDFLSWTTLGTLDTTDPTKIGLRITPTAVEQWAEWSGAWHLVQTFADTNHRGVFYASIEMSEQGSVGNVSMGCFGAGALNRQHIYRWLRA